MPGLDTDDSPIAKPTQDDIDRGIGADPGVQAGIDQAENFANDPANASNDGSNNAGTMAANGAQKSSGLDMAKSATSTAKNLKRAGLFAAVGGLGFALVGIIFALILFLLGFKLDHIKNLFIDYQFAGFHRSLSLRIDHIITTEAILSAESPGKLPPAGKASLYEKLRGYSPNGALKALGKENFQLDFEKGPLGRQGQLQAFEDKTSGKKVWRESKAPPVSKRGPNDVIMKDTDFLKALDKSINDKLFNESAFFRRRTVSDVYERSGIKLIKFKLLMDKLKKGAVTSQEATKDVVTDEIGDTTKGITSDSNIDSTAQDETQKAIDGKPTDIVPGQVPDKFSALKTVGDFSSLAFLTTMYCILNDLRDSIPQALSAHVNNAMSLAAGTYTMVDQKNEGKAPIEGINVASKQFDGFEKSAAYQRAMGLPVTGQDLDPQDYPTTVMGFDPTKIQTFLDTYDTFAKGPMCRLPGIGSACNTAIGAACSQILNPYVQGSVAAIDAAVTIFTLGGEALAAKSVTELVTEIAPKVMKLAGGVGASFYVFGHVIPSLIQDVSGVGGAGLISATDRTNRLDAGTNLLKNEIASTSGATKISDQLAMDQTQIARSVKAVDAQTKGPAYALFNLHNTYSIATTTLATIPTSASTMLSALGSTFAAVMQPTTLLNIFSGGAHAAVHPTGEAAFYGIQQYGWADSTLDGTDPAYNFINNQTYVEGSGKLGQWKQTFGKCMGAKTDVELLGETVNGFNYADCAGYEQTEDYKHYGVYVLDCFSVEQLANAEKNTNNFYESDCSSLVDATNKTAATTQTPSTPANKNIYILGDSIMRIADQSNNDIKGKLTAAGYTNVAVNWDGGRSITARGHDTSQSGLEAVAADKTIIAGAGTIVVELGTNYDDTEANMTNLMHQLKVINSTAKYYWVNVGSLGYTKPGYATTTAQIYAQYNAENTLISRLGPGLGYETINWCTLVFSGSPCTVSAHAKAGMLAADGVHPSEPKGIADYINLIISATATTTGTPATTDNVKQLATQILANANITYTAVGASRVSAHDVMMALSQGNLAPTEHQDGSTGQTDVNPKLLQLMLYIAQSHKIKVGFITNGIHQTSGTEGTHATTHAAGAAMDINAIDGVSMGNTSNATALAKIIIVTKLGVDFVASQNYSGYGVNTGHPLPAALTSYAASKGVSIHNYSDTANHLHMELAW